jgi:sugar/nucleoside kinase (ribokinase family)
MSLVVVGSVAYDGVETPHGKVDRMLGGAATYIGLAASYFTPVKIVAVVGDDFAGEDVDLLAAKGIDLEGLERVPGKTFFWEGKYSADMNDRETLRTDLNVFADFQPKLPVAVPRGALSVVGEYPAGAAARRARADASALHLAGGDTMNYWIRDYRAELLETMRDWDFLLINDSEARMLSGEHNLRRAAARILDMGPRTLVVKRGEYGAILFANGCHFIAPGYLLDDVFDPTGAGDCFAGGFIGYLAERGVDLRGGAVGIEDWRRAVIYGSVMGSFCCEQFGVDRFRTLTREEVEKRYREFKACTDF